MIPDCIFKKTIFWCYTFNRIYSKVQLSSFRIVYLLPFFQNSFILRHIIGEHFVTVSAHHTSRRVVQPAVVSHQQHVRVEIFIIRITKTLKNKKDSSDRKFRACIIIHQYSVKVLSKLKWNLKSISCHSDSKQNWIQKTW